MTTSSLRAAVAGVAAVGLAAVCLSPPVGVDAAVLTRTGTLGSGDALMMVVTIDGDRDRCRGLGIARVRHEVVRWKAPASRRVAVRLRSTPADMASFYVYDGAFDRQRPRTNCVAADNSIDAGGQKVVTLDVQRGRTYRIVVFDDTGARKGGTYRLEVTGAGVGGAARGPASGAGRKHLALPPALSCSDQRAQAAWRKKAGKVRKAVVRANGKVVGRFASGRVRPQRFARLTGLPAATTRLKAVLRLEGGGKVKVVRRYTRC